MVSKRIAQATVGAIALLSAALAAAPPAPSAARLRHGAYLTEVANCAGCHTRPGGVPFAGGRAIATAFGTVYTPNITASGAWSDTAWLAALRQGQRPDGTLLYPVCPYPFFARAHEDDLLAIKDYLSARPPVAAAVPHTERLEWPFSNRDTLFGWQENYLRPARFTPVPHQSAEWNRGAYLVETLGHCAACHREAAASDSGSALRALFVRGWQASAPAPALTAVNRFSTDALADYLRLGLAGNAAHERAHGQLGRLARSDLRAIAIYLQNPPSAAQQRALWIENPDPQRTGRQVYAHYCAGCHGEQGQGIPFYVPALRGAEARQGHAEGRDLIAVILFGAPAARTQAFSPHVLMPSFGTQLDDQQVAAVVNYLLSWKEPGASVTAEQVRRVRAGL